MAHLQPVIFITVANCDYYTNLTTHVEGEQFTASDSLNTLFKGVDDINRCVYSHEGQFEVFRAECAIVVHCFK